jgi:hypothetical protein
MFEWIVVFCVAADVSGLPINRCYAMQSAPVFEKKAECRVAAQQKVDWVMRQLIIRHPDKSPVVTGVCGTTKKEV